VADQAVADQVVAVRVVAVRAGVVAGRADFLAVAAAAAAEGRGFSAGLAIRKCRSVHFM
jgi:hypothetical protein